ncbi:MAG: lipid-A-disaccharide synthase [Ferruginibacter sp.]
MKYYIIAGEASGDLHGSNLVKELHKLDADAKIRCWGGDKMETAGATVVKHYRDLAFMGFTEVIKNLPTILKNITFCKKDILADKPDVLILIDYPGFNLRIAKWAKQQGFKIVYYISPQVWAWKENRVKTIKECVDKMLVILPFEKDYYKKWNFEVEYVGHPLVEVVDEFMKTIDHRLQTTDGSSIIDKNSLFTNSKRETKNEQPETRNEKRASPNKEVIALLPGSRKQEILKKLPIMLEVSKHFPQYQFIVAKAPGLDENFYNELLSPYTNVSSVLNQTYALLSSSKAALVTSGTATLETALFAVPEIICYKGNAVSYQIAKRLIKIKFIGLVNLIMDKEVVKELIQDDLNMTNIKNELNKLLNDPAKKNQLQNDYQDLKNILSKGGHASANAAKSIWLFLGN